MTAHSAINDDLSVNWHPFMQMKDFETYPPMLITHATGIKLYTKDTWVYDTISSWWCNILGHCHPDISNALQRQSTTLDHIMFGNFTHQPAIELSKRLVKITQPDLTRVYYSDNGSTAVEVSIKLSLHYWLNQGQPQKTTIVGFSGSYHGDTLGAMSVSGVSQYNQPFQPLMFSGIQLCNPSINESRAIESLQTELHNNHHNIAAVIVEPLLMGAGGMCMLSPAFLTEVRTLTHHYNVHLISDEVATGFGRTGHLFASQASHVTPDFMCLSKALTNGQLPLAVTMTTDPIFSAFYDDFDAGKTFYHGHTFTANVYGCAAANATLNILDTWNWNQQVTTIESILSKEMQALADEHPHLTQPRTIGTVSAINTTRTANRALFKLSQKGFEYHLTIRPLGNTLYVYLPLITSDEECTHIMSLFKTLLLTHH